MKNAVIKERGSAPKASICLVNSTFSINSSYRHFTNKNRNKLASSEINREPKMDHIILEVKLHIAVSQNKLF